MIDFIICAISIIGTLAVMYVVIGSYFLAKPIYKDDAKIAKLAKKLGFEG